MSKAPICAVISMSGPHGEPLACGYEQGHEGAHSWATLPTFVDGVPVELAERDRDMAAMGERLERAHALARELRRVVWAGQFGIPSEESARLQRAIGVLLRGER